MCRLKKPCGLYLATYVPESNDQHDEQLRRKINKGRRFKNVSSGGQTWCSEILPAAAFGPDGFSSACCRPRVVLFWCKTNDGKIEPFVSDSRRIRKPQTRLRISSCLAQLRSPAPRIAPLRLVTDNQPPDRSQRHKGSQEPPACMHARMFLFFVSLLCCDVMCCWYMMSRHIRLQYIRLQAACLIARLPDCPPA